MATRSSTRNMQQATAVQAVRRAVHAEADRANRLGAAQPTQSLHRPTQCSGRGRAAAARETCARPSAAVNKTGPPVCPRASTNVRSVQHGANMQCSQAAFVFPHSCGDLSDPLGQAVGALAHEERHTLLRARVRERARRHRLAGTCAAPPTDLSVCHMYVIQRAVRHLPVTYARYAVYAMGCAIYSTCGSAVLIDQPS